jgi:hypothetical protein
VVVRVKSAPDLAIHTNPVGTDALRPTMDALQIGRFAGKTPCAVNCATTKKIVLYAQVTDFCRRSSHAACALRPRRRRAPAARRCLPCVRKRARSIFGLSRFVGARVATIDLHYGHLSQDGR